MAKTYNACKIKENSGYIFLLKVILCISPQEFRTPISLVSTSTRRNRSTVLSAVGEAHAGSCPGMQNVWIGLGVFAIASEAW